MNQVNVSIVIIVLITISMVSYFTFESKLVNEQSTKFVGKSPDILKNTQQNTIKDIKSSELDDSKSVYSLPDIADSKIVKKADIAIKRADKLIYETNKLISSLNIPLPDNEKITKEKLNREIQALDNELEAIESKFQALKTETN